MQNHVLQADYAFLSAKTIAWSASKCAMNGWMVNHTTRVIAVYNGERGGTLNAIEHAARHQVPVKFIKA